MKKMITVLLAMMLALVLALPAFAEESAEDTRPYYDLKELGVKLYVDSSWEANARAYDVVIVTKTEYDDAGALKSGMLMLLPDEYDDSANGDAVYDAHGGIFGVSVRAEGAEQAADEQFAGYEASELGSADGYAFMLHVNPAPDTAKLDDAGKAMVETIRTAISADTGSTFVLGKPATKAELNTLIGDFSTKDVFGEAVDKSVLGNAPYTLIDIWATSCPPCISEMPELAELASEYEGRVQFMGIVTDAVDDDSTELARAIVEKTGVSYKSIVPDASLAQSLLSKVMYTPTKVIVDKDGVMIGQPIIGAQGKDALRAALDALPGVADAAQQGDAAAQ